MYTYIHTYITLHYITLQYSTVQYITLQYSTVQYITLHYIHTYIAVHCSTLHCIALHCIALHCIALHCGALHCVALHYIHIITYTYTWSWLYRIMMNNAETFIDLLLALQSAKAQRVWFGPFDSAPPWALDGCDLSRLRIAQGRSRQILSTKIQHLELGSNMYKLKINIDKQYDAVSKPATCVVLYHSDHRWRCFCSRLFLATPQHFARLCCLRCVFAPRNCIPGLWSKGPKQSNFSAISGISGAWQFELDPFRMG